MRDVPVYLISGNHPGFYSMFVPTVAFYPDLSTIEIGEGFGPHCNGAGYSYTEALTKRQWLEEACAGWFVPFIERLAAGESVPIEEIQRAYAALFGKELPCKMRSEL